MKDWGRAVRWCRLFDNTGDFCRLCLTIHNFWNRVVLKRNPTFVRSDQEYLGMSMSEILKRDPHFFD